MAYDEWNVWYRARGAQTRLEERYDLSDALAVATYLNVFVRQCRTVKMANLAQLVNVIAPIFTSETGLFLQTIYHPLRLYAEHLTGVALDAQVTCETRALEPAGDLGPRVPRVADLGPFKLLDVSATTDAEGREIAIGVVNRDREHPIEADVVAADRALAGGAAYTVAGPSPTSVNSFERPDVVAVAERDLPAGPLRHTFPPHSVTVLRLRLSS